MTSFRLSRRASADLSEIHRYIADRNAPAATKLMNDLFDLFHLLARNPQMGQARVDLRPNLRCVSHRSYVVFYYPLHHGVEIAAVIHGARDIESILGRRK
jgi:toxin ParE1/3/4